MWSSLLGSSKRVRCNTRIARQEHRDTDNFEGHVHHRPSKPGPRRSKGDQATQTHDLGVRIWEVAKIIMDFGGTVP